MLSRHRFCWLVGIALLATCLAPAVRWVLHRMEYSREQRAGWQSLCQLRDCRPADVSPDTWECATSWAITAYCNVCFSPDHVSLNELKRFRADLAERLCSPVDVGTVDWIWDRLGRTGPHGKGYQQRFEPQYHEELRTILDDRSRSK